MGRRSVAPYAGAWIETEACLAIIGEEMASRSLRGSVD